MKFQVSVNVGMHLVDESGHANYSQGLNFSEQTAIESDTWTGTGNKIDGLMARIREAINGDRD